MYTCVNTCVYIYICVNVYRLWWRPYILDRKAEAHASPQATASSCSTPQPHAHAAPSTQPRRRMGDSDVLPHTSAAHHHLQLRDVDGAPQDGVVGGVAHGGCLVHPRVGRSPDVVQTAAHLRVQRFSFLILLGWSTDAFVLSTHWSGFVARHVCGQINVFDCCRVCWDAIWPKSSAARRVQEPSNVLRGCLFRQFHDVKDRILCRAAPFATSGQALRVCVSSPDPKHWTSLNTSGLAKAVQWAGSDVSWMTWAEGEIGAQAAKPCHPCSGMLQSPVGMVR